MPQVIPGGAVSKPDRATMSRLGFEPPIPSVSRGSFRLDIKTII
jgi:hypothetical protein